MAAVKGTDTSLELRIHRAFQNHGWDYDRNVTELPGKPDFVFWAVRVVVFVDGDFWHGWRFSVWRAKLTDYWRRKIELNRRRDQAKFRRLRRLGWKVVRLWGHEVDRDLESAVARVAILVKAKPSSRNHERRRSHLRRRAQRAAAAR